MKKNLMILTMALMIALPVFGLAADAATPAAPEVQAAETTPVTPLGGQFGRRWNQTNPDTTVPQAGFVDADGDGVCDTCGNAQGTDPDAPTISTKTRTACATTSALMSRARDRAACKRCAAVCSR